MSISAELLIEITGVMPRIRSLTRVGADLPVTTPDLAACPVRVGGKPGGVEDGLYLLVVVEGSPEASEALRQKYPRAGIFTPFADSLPLVVEDTGNRLEGGIAFLTKIRDTSRLDPLAPRLADPHESLVTQQVLIAHLTEKIAGWNAPEDFSRPGHAQSRSPFEWLRAFTPLAATTTVGDKLEFGGKVYRNPAAFAMRPSLWTGSPEVTLPLGTILGRAGVENAFSGVTPFWLDARALESHAPVWLDWLSLELSALLHFVGFPMVASDETESENIERWWAWEQVCAALCADLLPTDPPAGRDSYLAFKLLKPLRVQLHGYIKRLPPTLQEHLKTGFWLMATAAALRLSADPRLPGITRKAALGYAASVFQRVADALALPPAVDPALSLSAKSLVPVVTLTPQASRVEVMPVFEPGCGLIIGEGKNPAAPALSLPITADDAQAVGAFLISEAGYAPERVRVLTHESATCARIKAGFEHLKGVAQPDSVAVIYFSGHGGVIGGQYYLIPSDAQLSDLAATSILMADFVQWVGSLPVRGTVLLLDCCHAGGASMKGESAHPAVNLFTPKAADPSAWEGHLESRALLASSSASQPSYILGGHTNSLFTEVLLDYWRGTGEVEVGQMFPHLRDEVMRRARAAGIEQHPRFSGHLGQIVLMRR